MTLNFQHREQARHIAEEIKIRRAMDSVHDELISASAKFPPFHSPHHGAAVIQEEWDEFWDEVKANNRPKQRAEVTQLAAMAIRFLVDIE